MTFQVEFDRGTAIESRLGCFLKRKKENCGAEYATAPQSSPFFGCEKSAAAMEEATSKGAFKLDLLEV